MDFTQLSGKYPIRPDFLVKNYCLSSEKRTRWIVRVWKVTYFRLRDQTDIGTVKY